MTDRFVSKFSQLHQFEIPVLRPGVPSFLGVPIARTPRDLEGADAAIIGVPYDRPATAGRPAGQWSGYREAPADVRVVAGDDHRARRGKEAVQHPQTHPCGHGFGRHSQRSARLRSQSRLRALPLPCPAIVEVGDGLSLVVGDLALAKLERRFRIDLRGDESIRALRQREFHQNHADFRQLRVGAGERFEPIDFRRAVNSLLVNRHHAFRLER